ncbi:MAG: DedA family protein [Gemmatimonadetes bacterium]|nr:MAG: DedA family protein [Gemmatimonadota bacterium]
MEALFADLTDAIAAYGPLAVFAMTLVETGFLVGLLLPAGPTIVLATVLAVEGNFAWELVALCTALGGFCGDQIGFVLGRRAGRRVLEGKGVFARRARRHRDAAEEIFGRHAIVAVSFARLISFVRTLMPVAAGTSHMTYRRFVAYDLLGVAVWASAHIAVGLAAGESWRRVARLMGVGWAVLFAGAAAVVWWLVKRRLAARRVRTRRARPASMDRARSSRTEDESA